MKKFRTFWVAGFVALAVALALVFPVSAGVGTKTVTLVTDNGGGSYTLTMASSAAVTVGDHFGARTGSAAGPGGLWIVTAKPSGTQVTVEDTLTEENGGTFGAPIAGDAWYGTPTSEGYSRIPHTAKAYDAAVRRNAYLSGKVVGGGTGASTAAGARANLGLAIGTDVQAYDADLTTLGAGGAGARTFLGLAIGTDVQAFDAQLTDVAAVTPTNDSILTGNGSNLTMQTLTSLLDEAAGSTQGNVLYRNASGWVVLAPGTAGQVLHSNGAGANVAWDTDDGALGASHAIHSSTHTDANTSAGGAERGDIMFVGSQTVAGMPAWDRAPHGATGTVVGWNGTDTNFYTLSSFLDSNFGSTQGQILHRTGAGWAVLAVGTSGQVLTSGGAGANVSWATSSAGTTRTVEDNTAGSGAPNQLTSGESSKILTNQGAGAENYEEFPAAAAGYYYTAVCKSTNGMRWTAVGDDTIRMGAYVTAAAGYVHTDNIGNTATFYAVDADEWIAVDWTGSWKVDGGAYACAGGEVKVLDVDTDRVTLTGTGDLHTFTIPAGQLKEDGDTVVSTFTLVVDGNADYDIKFGSGASLFSDGLTTGTYTVAVTITRTGATTQDVTISFNGNGGNSVYFATDTETLTSALALKINVSSYSTGSHYTELQKVVFYKANP